MSQWPCENGDMILYLSAPSGIFILRFQNGDYGIENFTGVSGYLRHLLRLTMIGFCGETASSKG